MKLQQKYVIKCPDGSFIIDPPKQDLSKLDLNTFDISELILNPFKASEAVLNNRVEHGNR